MSGLCSLPPVSNGSRGGGSGGSGGERGGEGGARRDAAWTARTSGRGILSVSEVVVAVATAAGLCEVGLDAGLRPLGGTGGNRGA